MEHYLDFNEDTDCFSWGGSFKDLQTFVNEIFDVQEDEGEVKEDVKHNSFSYKMKNWSLRFYTSTGNLMLFGTEQAISKMKLHEICDKIKNQNTLLTKDHHNAEHINLESSSSKSATSTPSISSTASAEMYSDKDEVIVVGEKPSVIVDELETALIKPIVDNAQVMKEISLLRKEINQVKERLNDNNSHDCVKIHSRKGELEGYRKENEDLKEQVKTQRENIKHLEDERASLITTIRILMADKNGKSQSPGTVQSNANEQKQGLTTINKHKKGESKNKSDASTKSSSTKSRKPENTADLVEPPVSKRKNTIILGDSIVSKIEGWKMSNKENRVSVRSFPGSTVEDMSDYIRPTIKSQPDNLILHVGTNNLKNSEPLEIAEAIVKICEKIEHSSPNTKIAVSELTIRKDSKELNEGRLAVNKILHSFAKTRDWKVIVHDKVDSSCLNGRGLHLNNRGILTLAKDFKQFLNNSN